MAVKPELSLIDKVTKSVAISISRRGFLKYALTIGTIGLGIRLFEPKTASAALTVCPSNPVGTPYCDCTGNCGCNQELTCCSRNGRYCYYLKCTCTNYCWLCGSSTPHMTVWDDGRVYRDCPSCS